MGKEAGTLDKAEAMAEAYKRGLLPPDMKGAYEEAMRRGLVPGGEGLPASAAPTGPSIPGAPKKKTFSQEIDDGIEEAAASIPGGYKAWQNSITNPKAKAFQPVIDEQGGRYYPGVGMSTSSKPKPKPPALIERPSDLQYSDMPVQEQKEKEFEGAWKQSLGYLWGGVGRVPIAAANSTLGTVDFLSQPGRWADDFITDTLGVDTPALVWDDKGIRVDMTKNLTPEERGRTGLPRIAMSAPKNGFDEASDFAGEMVGFLAPGGAIHKGMEKVGKTVSKWPGISQFLAAVLPKGSGAVEKGARYGARMASSVPEAAVQSGVFAASNAQKVVEGKDGTKVEMGRNPFQAAGEAMSNPLTYATLPFLSLARRVGEGFATGGKSVTPKNIQREMAPYAASNKDRALSALGDIPVPSGLSRKEAEAGLGILHRALSSGGVPDTELQAVVKRYNNAGPDRPAFAVFARSELSAYPKAIQNLDDALYEIGQKAPAVGQAIEQMRTSQGARLKDGLADDLGGQDRLVREKGLETKKGKIGEGYDEVLDLGAIDDESADNLRALLNDQTFQEQIPLWYRKRLELEGIDDGMSPPDMMGGAATRKRVTLQQRIQDNPLEVAHWLYSNLGKKIHTGKDPTGSLQEIQDALRPYLDKAGGRPYTELRDDYAARSGDIEALSIADRMEKVASSGYNVRVMRDVYKTATRTEKTSMRIAWREWIEDTFRKAKLSQDFLPLQKLEQEGVLDALKTILGEGEDQLGTKVVDRIKAAVNEQATIKGVDPQNTAGKKERLASGREAYAGKTGAMAYRDGYDLNKVAQDAAAALILKSPVPPRLALRLAQKAMARLATPSTGARTAAARTALETTPGGTPAPSPRVQAARARAAAAARWKNNGRFAKKPEFLDPEGRAREPFDEEKFAREMSDDGTPKVEGETTEMKAVIDEGYETRPRPKRLSGDRKALPPPSERKNDKNVEAELTPAQKYLQELQRKRDEAEAALDAKAAEKDQARGKAREAERYANDAEKERQRVEGVNARTKSEELAIERQRERQLAAEERARRAAQGPDPEIEPPVPADGPFGKFGRMREKAIAPAGDPRAVKDAVEFIVGAEEPAALQANLRRFARDEQPEFYTQEPFKRITDVLAALKGETNGVAPEAIAAVKGMNKANRKWLEEQLSDPLGFDLLDTVQGIKGLAKMGPTELAYKSRGPIAAGAAGIAGAGAIAKDAYDRSDKRTPEQRKLDEKIMARRGKWDDVKTGPEDMQLLEKYGRQGFEHPGEDEVRQMQRALKALGATDRYGNKLTEKDIDGKMGPRFREALQDIARRNGFAVNGQNPGGLTENLIEFLREYYQ